jgi:hypothetical protein
VLGEEEERKVELDNLRLVGRVTDDEETHTTLVEKKEKAMCQAL